MSWISYNPNPEHKMTIDCVVRAVSIAEGISWEEAHKALSDKARAEADMPSVNPIWADYLKEKGYDLFGLPNTCPRCYTVRDFARDYNHGTYVLGTGDHAVAVIDGNYIDTWDSGDEIPMYFFRKPLTKGESNDESNYSGSTAYESIPADYPIGSFGPSTNPATNSGNVPGTGTPRSTDVQTQLVQHDGVPS